jgi:hypothetical protein
VGWQPYIIQICLPGPVHLVVVEIGMFAVRFLSGPFVKNFKLRAAAGRVVFLACVEDTKSWEMVPNVIRYHRSPVLLHDITNVF